MEFQRQYGVATSIRFPIPKAGSSDLAATGDWTPATGDTKISKDGGNVANTGSNPSAIGGSGSVLWTLSLTAAEMQASEIQIQIVDSATKAVTDQTLTITTRMGGTLAANDGIFVLEVSNDDVVANTTAAEFFSIAPSTTEEATADHWIGKILLFTSGAARGEITAVTDSSLANSKIFLTYDAIISTPDDDSTAVIL